MGHLDTLTSNKVAMVGTRKPTLAGSVTAFQFGEQLARQVITVVSSLAIGINGEAHKGALNGSGKTIAVMATGLNLFLS